MGASTGSGAGAEASNASSSSSESTGTGGLGESLCHFLGEFVSLVALSCNYVSSIFILELLKF